MFIICAGRGGRGGSFGGGGAFAAKKGTIQAYQGNKMTFDD